jgi:hypothetical protein
MAILFLLAAECGAEKEAADAVASHFRSFTVALADGSRFPCDSSVGQADGAWWAAVYPEGVSKSGVTPNNVGELTEVGFVLYEQLRSAPPFRFALVGVEVYAFSQFKKLKDDLATYSSGVVLANGVWEGLGSPSMYVPFAPGYCWRPFIQAR